MEGLWHKNAIVYTIDVETFADGNGDGIGDFLGLTVETVSRIMTRLAREKAIVIVPDGVRLLDTERLERLAET